MIGIHTSKEGILSNGDNVQSLEEAIKRDYDEFKIKATQIFTYGPRNLRRNKIDVDKISKVCKKLDIFLSVHEPYVLSKKLWSITKENFEESKNTIQALAGMLDMNSKFTCNNVPLVVHFPRIPKEVSISDKGTPIKEDKRLKNIKKFIKFPLKIICIMAKKYNSTILLENVPDKDRGFNDTSVLNIVIDLIKDFEATKYVGFCIDTLHLWCGGVDLSSENQLNTWLNQIKKTKTIKMIHLNGGKKEHFCSGKDVHYLVGSDEDEVYNLMNLMPLLKMAKTLGNHRGIPVICEIHKDRGSSNKEIKKTLRNLIEIMNSM